MGEAMTLISLQTSLGNIKVELDDKATPVTTENFLKNVNDGFYNATLFHRVIDGFMIQGGGFEAPMLQKPTAKMIPNEAKTGLKNTTGTIAMARTSDPHSATSQFFINVANNAFLDFKSETPDGFGYCAFGKVIEGMDVVLEISKVATTRRAGHSDVPAEDVMILTAEQI
jgi:peptidyl-prolyl cis-trans isomerase B (cyclophilin B)